MSAGTSRKKETMPLVSDSSASINKKNELIVPPDINNIQHGGCRDV